MTAELRILQPMVRDLDPHATTDRRSLLGPRFARFDALVERRADGGFDPGLALEWSCSEDARSWRLALRPGVRFSDGTPLTAGIVVANLERIRDLRIKGELGTTGVIQGYLAGLEAFAEGDLAARLRLPDGFADLLDLLVDIPIMHDTLGTGPYRLAAEGPGRLEMSAMPDHWRGTPAADRVIWQAESDEERRVAALRNGEADVVMDFPIHAVPEIEPDLGLRTFTAPSGMVTALLIRIDDGPLSDRRVRQALNLGLDRDRHARELLGDDVDAVAGPLTPLHFGYPADLQPWPYDPERARALLADTGHASGLALTLDVPTTLPDESPALARAVAADWKQIGIDLTLRFHEDREAYAEMVRTKAIGDLCVFDSSPLSTFRVLREKCHSGVRGPWWQGYRNPDVDRLLDEARRTPEERRRAGIYADAIRAIAHDAPWVFCYSPRYRWGARRDASFAITPAGWLDLRPRRS